MIQRAYYFFVLVACVLVCQSSSAQTLGRGTLLVSTESLVGTMFEETIVLVVHHDDDGSIGIMINRPTNLQPSRVYPDIAGAASYTGVVYFGGPLAPGRPLMLARRSGALQHSSMRIIDDVYLSGDPSVLGLLDEVERTDAFSRIYAGSTQWGSGQLQNEVDAGAWETALGNANMIFSSEPESLWLRVMAAPRGNEIAMLD